MSNKQDLAQINRETAYLHAKGEHVESRDCSPDTALQSQVKE